jgi:hypothetical protein
MVFAALPPPTPCTDPAASLELRCPNLRMGTPSHVYAERRGRRVLLRGTSRLTNVGTGPIELRGRRSEPREMEATQAIHRTDGGVALWPTSAELYFKPIPGQGGYWKMVDAASLEIWTIDADGELGRRVRTSPKIHYCLRDLVRLSPAPAGAPRRMVYPACNQNPRKRSVTLGTSVGWVDRYPSSYYQQYVDVTGLRGRFAFAMTVDPGHRLAESVETDNTSWVTVRLPMRARRGA